MLIAKKFKENYRNGKLKFRFSKKLFIEILFFAVIIYFLLRFVEIKEFIKLISQIKLGWFLLAIFAQFLSFLFFALFKHEVLLEMKEKIRVGFLTKLSIAMAFIDIILPSQSISGHIFLFKALGNKKIEKGKRAILMISDFIVNYFVFLSLLILGVVYAIFYFKKIIDPLLLTIVGMGISIALLFIVFILSERSERVILFLFRKIPKRLNKVIKNFETRSEALIKSYYRERKKYKLNYRRLTLIMVLSYVSRIFTLFLITLSLNYYLTFDKAIIVYVFASLLAFISYIRLGFFEAGLTLALLGIGLNYNLAFATTIVFRVINLWLPLIFGYFFTRKIIKEKK